MHLGISRILDSAEISFASTACNPQIASSVCSQRGLRANQDSSKMHLKHEFSCGESAQRTLLLWNRYSDGLILRDARQHAIARVQRSDTQITSINMLGGGQKSSELRFEFWQLLVDQLFCHPTFGYVHLPEPNPFQNQLRTIGISDSFIETVHETLMSEGQAALVLIVWSLRPSAWRRLTIHCDLNQLPGRCDD